jgi:adenosylhomocysteinase
MSTTFAMAARSTYGAEGRLIELAAAEGHTAALMDMSFANQALRMSGWPRTTGRSSAGSRRSRGDQQGDRQAQARAMKVNSDVLTPEQEKCLTSWESGT